jgi:hypothetical protein
VYKLLNSWFEDQDKSILASLGEGSNAVVWPRITLVEDEDVDPTERPNNLRLMRIGLIYLLRLFSPLLTKSKSLR